MEKIKLIVFIIAGLVFVYFLTKTIIESPFEKLDRDYNSIIDYAGNEEIDPERVRNYREGDFRLDNIYLTKNRRIVYHLDEKHWIFWTGVVNLDDGLKFIYTPKYSRLLVVDRKTNEILSKKLFLRDVTNAKIVDGYVYFVYASFANYKLGRYKLDE